MTARRTTGLGVMLQLVVCATALAQTPQPQFGGKYAELDARRQQLIAGWVSRLEKTTGQSIEPGPLYDDLISLSTKTTFGAVTHALMTTRLTDQAGADFGDALAVIERIDVVRGEVIGERGDHQFRIYVRLTADAIDKLSRSTQFKRGADNSIYHKGYPINYRGQGGTPSIQISIALDRRNADVDVDYRASSFPVALFNGHLTSSNSDVRAGTNYDKHLTRWTGFQNWWQSFFGVRLDRPADASGDASRTSLSVNPRAGKKDIDVMAEDFLKAWLVEGNAIAAGGYISERAFACLANDSDDPLTFDRGMAPFQLLINMRAAYNSLGKHASLDGLVVGTRLTRPGLRVVEQPHGGQFVVYSVPDDIAASLDCGSQSMAGESTSAKRTYGNYFGTTFYVAGQRDVPVSLLWARDNGYWKIVSWRVGATDDAGAAEPIASPAIARIPVDPTLAAAASGFLDSWLVRKQDDVAFDYLSPESYRCYDLERGASDASASADDAGRKLRAALASASASIGTGRKLEQLIEGVEPVLSSIRVMDHPDAKVFTLISVPDALGDAAECSARAGGSTIPDPMPLEYGKAFGTTMRFKTRAGDAPILRLLWRKLDGRWKITSYGIELP
jgi:hypothetical protein